MAWKKQSVAASSAWTQETRAASPSNVDHFEAILRRQAEGALVQLRALDEEQSRCIDRIAIARKTGRGDEERIAADEHLHLSKRRGLLVRRLWFIHDEHKQARMLRAILEDQTAKGEIVNARRAGALETSIRDPTPLDAELVSHRRSLEERLQDVLQPNGHGAGGGPSAESSTAAEVEENGRAIEAELRRREVTAR